jgi:hypothetical protein
VGGGTRCHGGVRAASVGEGVRARVRAAAMVVGPAHAPLSGHQTKRASEREGWGIGG